MFNFFSAVYQLAFGLLMLVQTHFGTVAVDAWADCVQFHLVYFAKI